MFIRTLIVGLLTSASAQSTISQQHSRDSLGKRQSASNGSVLRIDLGYEIYDGYVDSQNGLNTWKGIRFAAPPIGNLRWQAPQPPLERRDTVRNASSFGAQCPQSQLGGYEYVPSAPGSEDCLFLNVYSPPNAKDLPVLVWIHGGGYGLGNGQQDLSKMMAANNNTFIGVAIQYRLGAFGFLSSDEVFRKGVVNAGLLDQHFALQWVQSHIARFGGNPSHVTVAGVSAGAGSVMLQTMAYGGGLGESLFTNAIAASPFLPKQYGYNDMVPSQSYHAFAAAAGCQPDTAYNSLTSIFDCLVSQNSSVLQAATATVSPSGVYGTWAFLPVTDGTFLQELPSRQLLQKRVNGRNLMVGNNALEGPLFTPQRITTDGDLLEWVQHVLPYGSSDDLAKTLHYYPGASPQNRADKITGEVTFVCPSLWLAESFSGNGRNVYKYQYSVSPATHGSDLTAYFGPAAVQQGPAFVKAFMTVWGNFITSDNPSITAAIADGSPSSNLTADLAGSNPATAWPTFSAAYPMQLNLNQSGGVAFSTDLMVAGVTLTGYADPGLKNNFTLDDAYNDDHGRGERCDFWRSLGAAVPA